MLDKIYCTEEQIERGNKALRLNGGSDSDYNYDPRLLAASSLNRKPTLKIKRLSFSGSGSGAGPVIKLKGASSLNSNIQRQLLERERINAEKALRLNSW
jgi:hypothetical protein